MKTSTAALGLAGLLMLASSPHAAPVAPRPTLVWQTTAIPSARFLGSLGVNTHVSQGYDWTKYVPALAYLGVHNIRDSIDHVDSLISLHQQSGAVVDILDAGDLPALISAGQSLAQAGALLSFEGANEPNNFPITYQGEAGGGNVGTWEPVAAFQRDLYQAVHADPTLKAYPVFHVSEGGAEVDNVGLQWLTVPAGSGSTMPAGTAYADYANPHNYVSSNCREYVDNQAWQAADPQLNGCWDALFVEYGQTWRGRYPGPTGDQLTLLPRVTSETGWDTVANPGGEPVQGKVLVNTYLAQFTRGWTYTFIYELGEGEGGGGNQGLFHADWTPKLSATYIHNLTTILADTGGAFTPGSLPYYVPHKSATVHNLLLQKSTGAFELVIWGESAAGSATADVQLGGKHAKVNVYDVTMGVQPVQVLTNTNRALVTISDHALILEVLP
jgi:hypothetical protein